MRDSDRNVRRPRSEAKASAPTARTFVARGQKHLRRPSHYALASLYGSSYVTTLRNRLCLNFTMQTSHRFASVQMAACKSRVAIRMSPETSRVVQVAVLRPRLAMHMSALSRSSTARQDGHGTLCMDHSMQVCASRWPDTVARSHFGSFGIQSHPVRGASAAASTTGSEL